MSQLVGDLDFSIRGEARRWIADALLVVPLNIRHDAPSLLQVSTR
jgi:hypothetical protein